VGAQTETELKEKKLRVEDALCATKAAVEEGIVVGGGFTLIKLSKEIDLIKNEMVDEEQQIGAEIVRKALLYPVRLIANNAGVNGSVVMHKVSENPNSNFGFDAATGEYTDLMISGVIDPAKVIRCSLENASSVARIFLTADCIVCEIEDEEKVPAGGIDYD
jgi:chaperonin GroEL